jgi:hypothetical protein
MKWWRTPDPSPPRQVVNVEDAPDRLDRGVFALDPRAVCYSARHEVTLELDECLGRLPRDIETAVFRRNGIDVPV